MSDSTQAPPSAPALQLDRVERADSAPAESSTAIAGIRCGSCGATISYQYYSLGGKSICASCRGALDRARAASRSPRAFGTALAFGLGAAIAGATVYYAVIAVFDLEIGIVAILIGWMVGRAIQKALPGGGARRYQILAAVLTYFAVGLAYMPIVFKANKSQAAKLAASSSAATPDSAAAADLSSSDSTTAAANATAAAKAHHHIPFIFGLGAAVLLAFALPVMLTFSSAGGIISALIIAIGMRQAWRMTGASGLNITGPLRVGRVGGGGGMTEPAVSA
jgi:hypothetical protein